MRVRIVSYEDINAWILGKFARRLRDELHLLGVEVDINSVPDKSADINHHIIYLGYNEQDASPVDTLMITHIDDIRKLSKLKGQIGQAKAGICMSRSVMDLLVAEGLPAEKMSFINPAHDGVINPRKIVIGITSKVQPDGCKREYMVRELFNHISPKVFSLSIMGFGWDKIVNEIRKKGFSVEYHNEFDYDMYGKLVPSFDYYLYTGQDEGSMGFIDALAAGVQTIVTPQGYHLDAPDGIVHAFNSQEELLSIFKQIEAEKLRLIDSVSTWTWKDYAIKHLEIWNHILGIKINDSIYSDGLNSLLNQKNEIDFDSWRKYKRGLRVGAVKRTYAKAKKAKDLNFVFNKLKGIFSK